MLHFSENQDLLIQQVGESAKEPAKEPPADEVAKRKRTRTKTKKETAIKIEEITVKDDDV